MPQPDAPPGRQHLSQAQKTSQCCCQQVVGRQLRRRAYEAELLAWTKWQEPCAAALNGIRKSVAANLALGLANLAIATLGRL